MLLDGFATRSTDFRHAAQATEAAGLNDYLSESVQGATHVLQWRTILSAFASTVPRVVLGPFVLEVANRDAGTLGVLARSPTGSDDWLTQSQTAGRHD